jgi:hypothetical protein
MLIPKQKQNDKQNDKQRKEGAVIPFAATNVYTLID